ncbi:MAG TPA: DUF4852 domain-containing protein [Patescibacteria group bacterium]|jgi:hypothetical protein|nr:DUF4852 domain-containing protein [Patescibacteria group bacterium]
MKKGNLSLVLGAVLLICCAGIATAQPAPDPTQGGPEMQMDTAPSVMPNEAPPEQAPPLDAAPTTDTAVKAAKPEKQHALGIGSTHDALDDYSSIIKEEPKTDDQIDKYQLTTIHNLSNLYWELGMEDLKDDEAVERYLFINDCDLYLKYSHNEFEWNKIKEATRKYLAKNMALFPTNFEILLPLAVGKYDQERGEFDIEAESQLNNVKKMDVAPNFGVPVCRSMNEWKSYPKNIILVLIRPFTLKSFPASPELADLYINQTAADYSKIPLQEGFARYQRIAFLRLKVHIIQYLETVLFRTRWRAVVVGQLDGYEIYADHEKFKLLYAQNIKDNFGKRHKQHHISKSDMEAATHHTGTAGTGAGPGENDTTSEDNSSEVDTSEGITGTGVDPGGMGTAPTNSDSPDVGEVVTPGGKKPDAESQ